MENEYISSDISERIKKRLKEFGVTAEQMLSELEMGKRTLQNYKTSMPKADNLAYIADYLNCSVDYLLGRTDNPNISTEFYIGGDNNGVQAIKNNGAVMINQSSKAEQQDEMTKELVKAFQSMSFTDKMEIMNAVLEKTKK